MKGKRLKEEQKNNKKIAILIIILIFIITLAIARKYPTKNEEKNVIQSTNTNVNLENGKIEEQKVSEELLKEKKFEGMKINNISLKREDGITFFSANIENITNKPFEKQEVEVIFVDESNIQMAIFTVEIEQVNVGKSIELPITTSMNLINAYNFYIEK